jgi:hypothetical protein
MVVECRAVQLLFILHLAPGVCRWQVALAIALLLLLCLLLLSSCGFVGRLPVVQGHVECGGHGCATCGSPLASIPPQGVLLSPHAKTRLNHAAGLHGSTPALPLVNDIFEGAPSFVAHLRVSKNAPVSLLARKPQFAARRTKRNHHGFSSLGPLDDVVRTDGCTTAL